MKWKIIETQNIPRFHLYKKTWLGWDYINSSDSYKEVLKLAPAHQHVLYCLCATGADVL